LERAAQGSNSKAASSMKVGEQRHAGQQAVASSMAGSVSPPLEHPHHQHRAAERQAASSGASASIEVASSEA
ncbi:hypothetical protein Dimus_030072, partial [Dionaea muscipula]